MTYQFEKAAITEALGELVRRAADAGITATVCLVGGAAIELLLGNRGSTRDLDSIIYRVGALDGVIAAIAAERGWPVDWLNSSASMFASDHDDPQNWDVLMQDRSVTVRVAPAEILVAMKLRAGRGRRDFDDLELLLEHLVCDSQRAGELFTRYYPHDVLNPRSQRFLEQWRQ